MQSREVRLPDSPPISLDDQDVQIVSAFDVTFCLVGKGMLEKGYRQCRIFWVLFYAMVGRMQTKS